MTAGSLVYALALAALSMSQGPLSYLACWAVMGVASSLALSTPSSIAIVQVAGPRARQAIAMLTIIGGLASTLFWPFTGVLEPRSAGARRCSSMRRSTCWPACRSTC